MTLHKTAGGDGGHTLLPVYGEMLLQICVDYATLPDPRTLTMAEIRFYYNGRRGELKRATAPRRTPTPPTKPRRF